MKHVELRRHTDNDGDVLSEAGVWAAVEIGRRLIGPYDLVVTSGAQRATQAAACFLAGLQAPVPGGVIVDPHLRSESEDRWREIYRETGSGRIEAFREADPAFVSEEGARFAEAVRRAVEAIPDGGRVLVVGHSPMLEAAVLTLTGKRIDPLEKGEAVLLAAEGEGFRVEVEL